MGTTVRAPIYIPEFTAQKIQLPQQSVVAQWPEDVYDPFKAARFSLEETSFRRSINDASQQPANTQVVEDVIVHKDVVQQDVVQEAVVEETVVDVIEKNKAVMDIIGN